MQLRCMRLRCSCMWFFSFYNSNLYLSQLVLAADKKTLPSVCGPGSAVGPRNPRMPQDAQNRPRRRRSKPCSLQCLVNCAQSLLSLLSLLSFGHFGVRRTPDVSSAQLALQHRMVRSCAHHRRGPSEKFILFKPFSAHTRLLQWQSLRHNATP
jgi:hypothetical protein